MSIFLQGYPPKFPDKLDGTLASYQVILPCIQRTVSRAPRLKFKNWKTSLDFRVGFWVIEVHTKRSTSSDIWEELWSRTKRLLKDPSHCKLTWHRKPLLSSEENQPLSLRQQTHMLDSASITGRWQSQRNLQIWQGGWLSTGAQHFLLNKFTKTHALPQNFHLNVEMQPFIMTGFYFHFEILVKLLKK